MEAVLVQEKLLLLRKMVLMLLVLLLWATWEETCLPPARGDVPETLAG